MKRRNPTPPHEIRQLLSAERFAVLAKYLECRPHEAMRYERKRGRHLLAHDPLVTAYLNSLVKPARRWFGDSSLESSYATFARYEAGAPGLPPHRDVNACSYTIDLCVFQREPWPLYVEGHAFRLEPNDAVLFSGSDHEHWREPMTSPDNAVGMVFFHFVEEGHWYRQEGPRFEATARRLAEAGRLAEATKSPAQS